MDRPHGAGWWATPARTPHALGGGSHREAILPAGLRAPPAVCVVPGEAPGIAGQSVSPLCPFRMPDP